MKSALKKDYKWEEKDKILFKDIPVGGFFEERHVNTREFEINIYGEVVCLKFQKTDKSHGKVIEQIGFGNERQIGSVHPIAPFKLVFKVE